MSTATHLTKGPAMLTPANLVAALQSAGFTDAAFTNTGGGIYAVTCSLPHGRTATIGQAGEWTATDHDTALPYVTTTIDDAAGTVTVPFWDHDDTDPTYTYTDTASVGSTVAAVQHAATTAGYAADELTICEHCGDYTAHADYATPGDLNSPRYCPDCRA